MSDLATSPSDCQAPFLDPIPGIIPFGTVTLLGGAPSSGKTTLLSEWCARWRDGRSICRRPTNPPTAFYYLVADRSWAKGYAGQFAKVGFSDIPHFSIVDDQIDLDYLKDGHAQTLFKRYLDAIDPLPGSHLLIEPLSPFFISGKPNDQRDVARSLVYYSRICQNLQINITASVHFGKQKGDMRERYARPQDRIAGSTSFAGFSYTQMYIIEPEPPRHPCYRFGWVPRASRPEEFAFVRDDQGLFIPASLEDQTDTRASKVFQYLPPDYASITLVELIDLTQLPRKTVQRALDDLIDEDRVERVARGTYRRLRPQ